MNIQTNLTTITDKLEEGRSDYNETLTIKEKNTLINCELLLCDLVCRENENDWEV